VLNYVTSYGPSATWVIDANEASPNGNKTILQVPRNARFSEPTRTSSINGSTKSDPVTRITGIIRGNMSFYYGVRGAIAGALLYGGFLAVCSGSEVRVGTCQFPISADIASNGAWIQKQMAEAQALGADIVHFPEGALSGYAGADRKSLDDFPWDQQREELEKILAVARRLHVWVILGVTHRLSGDHKPHNSLYVIDPNGAIVDRYDKRFCTTTDLKYYSPGDHFVTFDVNGVHCGLLICYDSRFPELYRQYSKQGVQLILQSFHNVGPDEGSILGKIIPPTMQAYAAANAMFISMCNSSTPHSWESRFITPDGLVERALAPDQPGVMINVVDTAKSYYDASGPFRADAINGKLNSGEIVSDPRSSDRKSY